MDRVKNDYFETITIVDPLELPELGQPGLGMTTIIPVRVENHFLQDFNQQAVSDCRNVAICNGQMSIFHNCSSIIVHGIPC